MKTSRQLPLAALLGALVSLSLPLRAELVSFFLETFDSGETEETRAPVDIATLGWNVHHSFAGVYLPGLATGAAAPGDTVVLNTTVSAGNPPAPAAGDHLIGEPFGYAAFFIGNYPLYGQGTEGERPALPGPHPVTGEYYHNRTLALFLWKEHAISAAGRAGLRQFNFVQGNRSAIYHQLFPAVRIGDQWFVYRLSPEELAAVRILGRPSEFGMYGEEGVFNSNQFSEGGAYANHYNAQPYSFTWSESGWTALVFDGAAGANSTGGMVLGEPLAGDLPAGDITAVGVFSPEFIDPEGPSNPGYNFNGYRIDSIQILGEPVAEEAQLYTFTFNNEGRVDGRDRPIQAAQWDGVYTSAALPLVTNEFVFADLSEGVIAGMDLVPGAYKAGFVFVSGKNNQPAPEGFLVWSGNTGVVDIPQWPPDGNPQTVWYSESPDAVVNLNQLLAGELRELGMYINPRNKDSVRYHFALKISGAWYVSEEAFQSTGDWTPVSLDPRSANWLTGVVGDDFLNLDFTATPPQVVTIGGLPASAQLDTIGIYIDTDDHVGQNDTWARLDSFTLTAVRSTTPIPPTILTQPAGVAVLAGETVEFSVEVLETDVTFQWRKGGVDIENATDPTLLLETVNIGDAGSYTVRVTGPRGSVVSDPAVLAVYPVPVVDPLVIEAAAAGQDDLLLVDAVAEVEWTSASDADWIAITYGETGSGGDFVMITIAPNPDYEPRTGTLLVAGATVTVNQAGRPLPQTFEEAVGAVANADGSWTSPWFGTYEPVTPGWILHAVYGLLHTGAVVIPEDMYLYSFILGSWIWTNNLASPILYDLTGDLWIYYIVVDGTVFYYSYPGTAWSWL